MTVPIHSVKHVKATYRKYQVLALIVAMVTLLAVLLAALFSFQLSRLSRNIQRSANTQLASSHQALTNKINLLEKNMMQLEKQSTADKATIESLTAKTLDLSQKLAEARKAAKAAAAKPAPQATPQPEPAQTAPQAEPDSEKVVPTPQPSQQPPAPADQPAPATGAQPAAPAEPPAPQSQPEPEAVREALPAKGGNSTSQP